ncbi:hypothetical protein JCM6882_003034 [Rhodosporidiobolus microsporus]
MRVRPADASSPALNAPQTHPCPLCSTTFTSHALLVAHFAFAHPSLSPPDEAPVPPPLPIYNQDHAASGASFSASRTASASTRGISPGSDLFVGGGGTAPQAFGTAPAAGASTATAFQPFSFALPPEHPPPPPLAAPSSSTASSLLTYTPYTPYNPASALLSLPPLPSFPPSLPSTSTSTATSTSTSPPSTRPRSLSPLASTTSTPPLLLVDRATQTDLSAADLEHLPPVPGAGEGALAAFLDLRDLGAAGQGAGRMEVEEGEEVDQLWGEEGGGGGS